MPYSELICLLSSNFFQSKVDSIKHFNIPFVYFSRVSNRVFFFFFISTGPVSFYLFNSISSVPSLSRVQLFSTPWIAARQASLTITNSRSLLRLMSIQSVMPSSHLMLCCPLVLLPPIPPSIRVFSNESTLRMRWPNYWSFSLASFLPKKSQGWSPSEWTGWISLYVRRVKKEICYGKIRFSYYVWSYIVSFKCKSW